MSWMRGCHVIGPICLLFLISVITPARAAHARTEDDAAVASLFAGEWVPRIEIKIDEAGLNVLRGNSANRYGPPSRPNALATVLEGTNVYRQVAVHLKGSAGSFRGLEDKPAFTLHFNEHLPSQRFHGLEKISLNNSVQDETLLCEVLGRRVFNATSVPVPRAGHAAVTFNGERLGMYVLLEGWNKQFLKRHFKDAKGNFYEGAFRDDITASLDVKSGTGVNNRSDLDALIAAAQEPNLDQRFADMARVLDIDRFVTFIALEVMLNHWDGYSLHVNNYRIFHDNDSGKLVFMPHGMDQLFGMHRRMFDSQLLPPMSGMAARALLETRAGRNLYLDRIAQLQTNVFAVTTLTAAIDKLARLLRPAMQSDPGALAEFNATVSVLRQRVAERHAELEEQLTEMKTPQFNSAGEANLAIANFKSTQGPRPWQRRGRFGGDFREQSEGRNSGASRAVILLQPGRYGFQALVHTRVGDRAIDPATVALRSSEGTTLRRQSAGTELVLIEHDFDVHERSYVELFCDLGATEGLGALDRSSLKLVRR